MGKQPKDTTISPLSSCTDVFTEMSQYVSSPQTHCLNGQVQPTVGLTVGNQNQPTTLRHVGLIEVQ